MTKKKEKYMYKIWNETEEHFMSPGYSTKSTWTGPSQVVIWLEQLKKSHPRQKFEVWMYPLSTAPQKKSENAFIAQYNLEKLPAKRKAEALEEHKKSKLNALILLDELIPLGTEYHRYAEYIKLYDSGKLSQRVQVEFENIFEKVKKL